MILCLQPDCVSLRSQYFLKSGLWTFPFCPLTGGQLSANRVTTSAITQTQHFSLFTESLSKCLLETSHVPQPDVCQSDSEWLFKFHTLGTSLASSQSWPVPKCCVGHWDHRADKGMALTLNTGSPAGDTEMDQWISLLLSQTVDEVMLYIFPIPCS